MRTDAVSSVMAGAQERLQQQAQVTEASRQFEALLLQRMMNALTRTTRISGTGSAGSSTYGSMVVEALSDAITRSGGLGLTDMMRESVLGQAEITRNSKELQKIDKESLKVSSTEPLSLPRQAPLGRPSAASPWRKR